MTLILTLDQNGQPTRWSTWQTAVCYQAKDLITWSMGEVAIVAHGGKSRITGEQSIVTLPSIIAVKNSSQPKYRTPALTNKNLFRRDLNMCAYCGRIFIDSKLTRDHIVPVSRGGKDIWSNVATACKPCNNYKDDFLLEELDDMKLLYVPYTPDRCESLILRNRNIRYDQMEFLTQFLPAHSRAGKIMEVYSSEFN